jgi:hypothetical protein
MGLDSYINVDNVEDGKTETVKVVYWRKHNAMHNWFCKEALAIGLVDNPDDFNCVELPITQNRLNRLIQTVKDGNLEPVGGFFFGNTDYDPKEEMEADLADLAKVQEEITSGNEPYYTSWW